MTKGIIIQCRDKSVRMKNKPVRPFHEGKSILEIIITKLSILGIQIVVATTENSPKTVEICKKMKIEFFIGDEDNVAKRLYDTAKKYNFKGFFRVCADNPFISTALFYPVFAWAIGYDYVAFDGCMERHEGFWCEFIMTDALMEVLMLTKDPYDLQHVTPFIKKNFWLFSHKIIPIPKELEDVKIRLTVDTKDDFKLAQKLYPQFGDKWWMEIVNHVKEHPEIEKQMKRNMEMNPK